MYRSIIKTLPALFALLLLAGCSAPENNEATEEAVAATASNEASTSGRRQVRVETLSLQPTSFKDVIEVTGSVEANNDATVSAQGSGTLVYRVKRGAYVPRYGRIAQIDSTLMHASLMQTRAQVAAAQAQFDLANDTFRRQEPLFQDSIISAIEFENVRAQLNQSKAQLDQTKALMSQIQKQLDNTRITASFGGTVETFFADIGEQVSPGMQIARIVNTQRVKITAGVPERYANDIEAGSSVKIVLDSYGGAERMGAVSFVGKAINTNSRTFPVEVQLDNSEQTLKPEMVARIYLTRTTLENAIVIPQNAVPLDETGHSVFVVIDEGGTLVAERRPVTLGPSYGGNVVVEQGLYPGDEVVILGQYNLTSGDAVEVVNTTQSVAAAVTQ
ncbi:MAG: efflux RND transporter periplasmic adaptor subunit [Rhodothermales bacterium]